MGLKEKQTNKTNTGDWEEMNKVEINKGPQRTETLLALSYSANSSRSSNSCNSGDKYLHCSKRFA